ncbi:hypothetical protein A2U01_0054389, partial [Trifolium medium]|nr:hypothetical protein [Trifolium medium]
QMNTTDITPAQEAFVAQMPDEVNHNDTDEVSDPYLFK